MKDLQTPKKNFRKLTRPDIVKLFLKSTSRLIKNKMLIVKGNSFTINNRKLANRLNGTNVTIRYDEDDMSLIYLYEDRTDIYLCELIMDKKIKIVQKKGSDDRKLMKARRLLIDTHIRQNMEEIAGELDDGFEEFDAIPIVNLLPKNQRERILDVAENRLLISDAIRTHTSSKIERREVKGHKNRGIKKSISTTLKGSMKIIKRDHNAERNI